MADTALDPTTDSKDDGPSAPSGRADVPAPPQPGTKRKKLARTALTLREKAIVKSFCEQKVTDCKARGELVPSQEFLRREVATHFGWSCGRSTLSKIISMDWKLLRGSHEGGEAPRNPNMKRRRRPLFPAFEADLAKFILTFLDGENGSSSGFNGETQSEVNTASTTAANGSQPSEDGGYQRRPLTEALILEEAQRLKRVHSVSDDMLVLSVGWLARFKHRHCIRLRKSAGVSSKSAMPQHQQVTVMADGSTESGLMGGWSTGLIPPNCAQTQLASEQTISNQPMTNSPGNQDDILPSSSQQDDKLELTSSLERVASTRGALCFAQGQPAKRSVTTAALLEMIPESIRELACSCEGSAVDDDFIRDTSGLRVAVVGFGSVVEAFLLATSVGASGFVMCVEACPLNVYLAEQAAESFCLRTLGLPAVNMKFIVAESSGIAQSSSSAEGELKNLQGQADLVICTCSIQSLAFRASKKAILNLAFGLLKVGGELRATDLVCSRRLSLSEYEEARLAAAASDGSKCAEMPRENSKQLQQKLLLRAPYAGDLQRLFRSLSGDVEVRTENCSEAEAAAIDVAVASLLPSLATSSDVRFRRITFHAFRLQDVEDPAEDYGQTAIFNGRDIEGKTAVGADIAYRLDDEWNFRRGVCTPIDGNTAQILQSSWMQRYFTVNGDRSSHLGPFIARARSSSAAVPSTPRSTLDSSEMGKVTSADEPSLTMSSPTPEPIEVVNI